jgi:2-dehydro-3-deoxyphosphooctonate aldolase (KDO 8-P synthase)
VKKGQFLSPWDMQYALEKIVSARNRKILLTERGSSFGYHNLVVDMRGIQVMSAWGYPVVLDVTHSLQLPGGEGKQSGGQPEFIETLARAGVAAGVDAIFMEVHDNPPRALSDGPNALGLKKFPALAETLRELGNFVRKL